MKKINLLLSLYFCQGLPGEFLVAALPIMIRESGGSFTLVGFSARLSLPWLLKSLWAPLADVISFPPAGDAFRKLGLGFWLFLFYAKFGETFGSALVKPLLVDLGFSREQTGLMDGIIGGIATILGAIVAGLSYRRFGLQRMFAFFVVLQGIFLGLFGVASTGPLTFMTAARLNGIENFAGGGVGVAVFALAMSTCRRSISATQFTLCPVLVHSWRLCGCAHKWYYGGCAGTDAGHAHGQSHGDIIGAYNHANRLV